MATKQISTRRLAISKANTQVVVIVAVASFVTMFSLVASNALWSQNKYQARVIHEKERARDQLKTNLKAYDKLAVSYQRFNRADPNVIGGSRDGGESKSGANSKIILNALPSSYDFPALTSSLEKIVAESGVKISGITGIDDQVNQQTNLTSPDPKSVEIAFSFTVTNTNYAAVQQLIERLQKSIRPIQIDKIDITGSASNMSLSVNAHTYYQPAKDLQPTKKVVK